MSPRSASQHLFLRVIFSRLFILRAVRISVYIVVFTPLQYIAKHVNEAKGIVLVVMGVDFNNSSWSVSLVPTVTIVKDVAPKVIRLCACSAGKLPFCFRGKAVATTKCLQPVRHIFVRDSFNRKILPFPAPIVREREKVPDPLNCRIPRNEDWLHCHLAWRLFNSKPICRTDLECSTRNKAEFDLRGCMDKDRNSMSLLRTGPSFHGSHLEMFIGLQIETNSFKNDVLNLH